MKKCLIIICIVNFFVLAQHFNYGNEVKKISLKKGNTHFDLSARINIPDMINKNKSAKNASQNNEFRIDSIYNRCVDNFDTKNIFTYQNGNLYIVLEKYFLDGKWENTFFTEFHYDSFGRIDTALYFFNPSTINENWKNVQITTIEYDSMGNYISFTKNLIAGEYVYDFYYKVLFDSEHNPLYTETGDWINGNWEVIDKTNIYYDQAGGKDSTISKRITNGQSVNRQKITYNYDYFNLTSSEVYQNWDFDHWENSWFESFNYNGDWNKTYSICKYWDKSQWIPDTRYFYHYDSNKCFVNGTCEGWNSLIWIPYDGHFYRDYSYTYGASDRAAEITTYYSLPTNVKYNAEQIKGLELSPNYPNPFNPVTNIRFSIPENGAVELKVYNMLGQEISTLLNEYKVRGEYEIKFYASNLPSGVYLYRLKYSGAILSKKMLLQK